MLIHIDCTKLSQITLSYKKIKNNIEKVKISKYASFNYDSATQGEKT